MKIEEQIELLQQARDLLRETYVPWTSDDKKGGHCHIGCLIAVYAKVNNVMPWVLSGVGGLDKVVDDVARRMYPDLTGARALRKVKSKHGTVHDFFDIWPAVYVNNQLGKEAILGVYDEAIRSLKEDLRISEEMKAICCENENAEIQEVN